MLTLRLRLYGAIRRHPFIGYNMCDRIFRLFLIFDSECEFSRKSQQPELISLLLDIFEYDYASVQLLTDASPTKILNGQLFDVHDFKDFETLPLVGLMLAQFAGTPRKCVFSVVKGRPVEVGRLFVEKFCQCEVLIFVVSCLYLSI